jgi:hypothetical protein
MSFSSDLEPIAVPDMPITAFAIPTRTTSKPRHRKSKSKLPLSMKNISESKLRPLPIGWIRQYDIM